jgi:RNA polymerase sigma-70 factor (ECF subfamily)
MLISIESFWKYVQMATVPPSTPGSVHKEQDVSHDDTLRQDFESFFRLYEPQLSRYLWQMVGDETLVADLCQETFFRAWQYYDHIRNQDHARAWLYRVATNLVSAHYRHISKYSQILLTEEVPGSSDPGHQIANRDVVVRVLQTLTIKQRSALIFFEVYGLSSKEIAQVLGTTVHAVKMLLHRGREQFRLEYLREDHSI